jgi:large subunit ribosomal protein L24
MKIENRKELEKEKQRQNRRIKKGDKVKVISGNCLGMIGTVLTRKEDSFIVQGINVRKRHVKKTRDQAGSIVSIEKPIHASNLRLCTEDNKPVRLKVQTDKDGSKQFVYSDGNQQKQYRSVK